MTEAGLKLLTLQGTGNVTIRISPSRRHQPRWRHRRQRQRRLGGRSRTKTTWPHGDLNGDGLVNASDRQILYANYGWHANLAPVAVPQPDGPALKTHTDLTSSRKLDAIAVDNEGRRHLLARGERHPRHRQARW